MARAFERLVVARQARAYKGSLETSIQRRTRELEVALSELESNYQMTLEALVAALDSREHETFSHSLRVRAYTRYLARRAGYPPALLPSLEQGALLHDIGKIAVADAILLKPAKLTAEEWVEMRKHPLAGDEILKRVPFLRPASAIVRHHHERFDGTGYPDGLKGAEIPLGARLFTRGRYAGRHDQRPEPIAKARDLRRRGRRSCGAAESSLTLTSSNCSSKSPPPHGCRCATRQEAAKSWRSEDYGVPSYSTRKSFR